MAYKTPRVAGSPAPDFIPELWAGEFLQETRDKTVSHMITNNKFEVMLKKMGDTVKFSFPGRVPNRKWKTGQKFAYVEVSNEQFELVIDRARQWGFVTHKTDDVQAIIKSYGSTYKKQATDEMAEDLDREIFTEMDLGAFVRGNAFGEEEFNFGSDVAPASITKDNGLQLLTNIATAGANLNWSMPDTWAVVPPWYTNCLANSDLKDVSMMGGGGVSPLKAGIHTLFQTRIGGATLIVSNLLPKVKVGGKWATKMLFGTKRAFCLAMQIEQMGVTDGGKDAPLEMYHYGVDVYGMKQLYPKEIGCAVITPGTNAFAV